MQQLTNIHNTTIFCLPVPYISYAVCHTAYHFLHLYIDGFLYVQYSTFIHSFINIPSDLSLQCNNNFLIPNPIIKICRLLLKKTLRFRNRFSCFKATNSPFLQCLAQSLVTRIPLVDGKEQQEKIYSFSLFNKDLT